MSLVAWWLRRRIRKLQEERDRLIEKRHRLLARQASRFPAGSGWRP